MKEPSSPLERLKQAYDRGGLSEVGSLLGDYVKWRTGGSPPDPTESIEARLDRVDAAVVVVLMRDYYERATTAEETKISIVLPTRDRPITLAKAIESVLGQTYSNWELLVVNNSETIPALPDDPRIHLMSSAGPGVAAARNLGLAEAQGGFITFLDDDNVMDRLWLKAIALTIEEAPSSEIAIGAQLVAAEPGSAVAPRIRFPARFEWDRLIEGNFVDMAMLAHVNGLPTRFDESLPALVDWDYVVRLTHNRTPTLIPALTGTYQTGSPARISYGDRRALHKRVRAQFQALAEHSQAARTILGGADVDALRNMLTRFRRQRQGDIRVVIAADTRVAQAIREAVESAGISTMVPTGEPIDVIIAEGLPTPDAISSLAPDGLLVGLNAHRVDYEDAGLPYFRRLGDHLSLGSRTSVDPETLFDGATLVKLGFDRAK